MSPRTCLALVCLVELALVLLVQASGLPSDIISVVSHGKKVTIPTYRPEITLSNERYAFDNKLAEELARQVNFLTNQILVKRVFALTITKNLVGFGSKLWAISKENKELKLNDKVSPVLNSGLGAINGEMLDNMMASSGVYDQLSGPDAQERMQTVMDAIVQITKLSNTGLVLRWPDMKIDGESVEQYMKPVIQKLIKGSFQIKKVLEIAADRMKATKFDRAGRELANE